MKNRSTQSLVPAAVVFLLITIYNTGWNIYSNTGFIGYLFSGKVNSWYEFIWLSRPVFDISGIIAAILLISGRYKFSRWVLFLSCVYFFQIAFSFSMLVIEYFISDSSQTTLFGAWSNYLLTMLELAGYFYSTVVLRGCFSVLLKKSNSSGNTVNTEVIFTGMGKRLFNILTDYLVLFIFIVPQIGLYTQINKKISIYGTELMILFLYYFFTECIFKITPAKILTGCTVINTSGNKPGFFTMLGRTFCRFIPFDAFSYLGKDARGWHDSIPNVYVVEERLKVNEETGDHSIV